MRSPPKRWLPIPGEASDRINGQAASAPPKHKNYLFSKSAEQLYQVFHRAGCSDYFGLVNLAEARGAPRKAGKDVTHTQEGVKRIFRGFFHRAGPAAKRIRQSLSVK